MPDHLTYGRYLHLDELLAAQTPLSHPEAHDELLFIIQHQTSELWLKLALHELTGRVRRPRRRRRVAGAEAPGAREAGAAPAHRAVVGARDAHDAAARAVLTAALERRGLDDEFLHLLARRGHPVPADVPARDAREPHREDPRTIGFRTGTGGTTGASFLRRVLDLTFFPELYAVRTALGGGA